MMTLGNFSQQMRQPVGTVMPGGHVIGTGRRYLANNPTPWNPQNPNNGYQGQPIITDGPGFGQPGQPGPLNPPGTSPPFVPGMPGGPGPKPTIPGTDTGTTQPGMPGPTLPGGSAGGYGFVPPSPGNPDQGHPMLQNLGAPQPTLGGMAQGQYPGAPMTQPMPSYDLGTRYVPTDQTAHLQAGEAVVPASRNPNNPTASIDNTFTGGTVGEGGNLLSRPSSGPVAPQMLGSQNTTGTGQVDPNAPGGGTGLAPGGSGTLGPNTYGQQDARGANWNPAASAGNPNYVEGSNPSAGIMQGAPPNAYQDFLNGANIPGGNNQALLSDFGGNQDAMNQYINAAQNANPAANAAARAAAAGPTHGYDANSPFNPQNPNSPFYNGSAQPQFSNPNTPVDPGHISGGNGVNAVGGGTPAPTNTMQASGTPQPITNPVNNSTDPGSNANPTPGNGYYNSIPTTDLSGVNPTVASYLDPSMAFQMQQGLGALTNNAAATGQVGSGNTLKDILNYSQGLASTDYNQAFNQASNQQQYGLQANNQAFNQGAEQQQYGLQAQNQAFNQQAQQQGFNYQQQLNNQNIPFSQAMQEAQLGMTGAQGQQSVTNLLATLLGQNAQNLGNAQGTGTIGGSNAISNALSQAIANYLGQNTLNRVLPQGT